MGLGYGGQAPASLPCGFASALHRPLTIGRRRIEGEEELKETNEKTKEATTNMYFFKNFLDLVILYIILVYYFFFEVILFLGCNFRILYNFSDN